MNFSQYLDDGETITSGELVCAVVPGSGSDDGAAGRLTGDVLDAAPIIAQIIEGCVAGVTYLISGAIVTNKAPRKEIWAHIRCIART